MGAYKYAHQLYFYKLLVEGSHAWRGYKVIEARLEFVEPTDMKTGAIVPALTIQFSEEKEQEIKRLIKAVWSKIQSLDLPDTSKYSPNFPGTKAFEHDLIHLV